MTEKIGHQQAERMLRDSILAKERKDFGQASTLFTNAIIYSEEILRLLSSIFPVDMARCCFT